MVLFWFYLCLGYIGIHSGVLFIEGQGFNYVYGGAITPCEWASLFCYSYGIHAEWGCGPWKGGYSSVCDGEDCEVREGADYNGYSFEDEYGVVCNAAVDVWGVMY